MPLLDARVDAEATVFEVSESGRRWLEGRGRVRAVIREGRVRIDLDGVAKGWFADRALAMLGAYPAVLVDADGGGQEGHLWPEGAD